jgi:hypothetical protein
LIPGLKRDPGCKAYSKLTSGPWTPAAPQLSMYLCVELGARESQLPSSKISFEPPRRPRSKSHSTIRHLVQRPHGRLYLEVCACLKPVFESTSGSSSWGSDLGESVMQRTILWSESICTMRRTPNRGRLLSCCRLVRCAREQTDERRQQVEQRTAGSKSSLRDRQD